MVISTSFIQVVFWNASQCVDIGIYLLQVCVCLCVRPCTESLSRVRQFVAPWTVAHQAPLSMEFSRQEDERVAISFSRGSSLEKEWTWVSALQQDSLLSEPPGCAGNQMAAGADGQRRGVKGKSSCYSRMETCTLLPWHRYFAFAQVFV